MKLSRTQKQVRKKMETGKWYSAYDLECRITTLEALHKKDIVQIKFPEPISYWWYDCRTEIKFRLY